MGKWYPAARRLRDAGRPVLCCHRARSRVTSANPAYLRDERPASDARPWRTPALGNATQVRYQATQTDWPNDLHRHTAACLLARARIRLLRGLMNTVRMA